MISENDYKMAALILEHSTQVQENENVMVQLIGLNGINLLRALVEQIREKGAHPFVQIEDTETQKPVPKKDLEDTTPENESTSVDIQNLFKITRAV